MREIVPRLRKSGHENPGPGGSVWSRAYGRVIRDRGLLGERSRQAVLDDGLRARAFRWPPLRLARIVPRARIGLCRSPALRLPCPVAPEGGGGLQQVQRLHRWAGRAASAISETGAELGGALGIAILGSIGTAVYRGEITSRRASCKRRSRRSRTGFTLRPERRPSSPPSWRSLSRCVWVGARRLSGPARLASRSRSARSSWP